MRNGRNLSLTTEVIDELCRYVSNGMTNTDACKMLNISESAFYQWQKDGREELEKGKKSIRTELLDKLTQARVKFKLFHINNISQAGKQDWRASAWMLERMFPKEFSANRETTEEDANAKIPEIKVEMVDNAESMKRVEEMEKIVMEEIQGKKEDNNDG